ncbi:MAG: sigma-E processing peptidase SpoIIGA [Kyrpidia sp.]|nr:sigma-E processing peptidase SpoIIGA [Kyrpidia sp.]
MYGDLVFAVNALMDAATLWATAWILRIRPRPWRVIPAAALGAVYALAALFLPVLGDWWFRTAVSVVMLRLALPLRGGWDLIQGTACFYLANFVFAGAVIALQVTAGGSAQTGAGLVVFTRTPGWLWRLRTGALLAGIPLGLMALAGLYRVKVQNDRLFRHVGRLVIVTPLGSCEVPALVDSGNQLLEPLSGWPVVIAEAGALRSVLPEQLTDWLMGSPGLGRDPPRLPEVQLPEEWSSRVRVVPWRGIGGRGGVLVAIRPDMIQMRQGRDMWISDRVYVAVQGQPVDARDRYAAIVPASVFDSEAALAERAGH